MCVYSVVLDHYKPFFQEPFFQDIVAPAVQQPQITTVNNFQIISKEEIEYIKKLITEFKEALEAAKLIDRLIKQPDCEDPEKKKLEDRVALLEQRIAQLSKSKEESEVS